MPSSVPREQTIEAFSKDGALRAGVDLLVLSLPLVLLNGFVFRRDLGWLETNPSPFLLIPFLIGVRYGFGSGVLAGIASVGFSLGIPALLKGDGWMPSEAYAHRYLLCSLVVCGGIAGAVGQWIRAQASTAKSEAVEQRSRADDAEARAEVYAEASAEMERRLVFHGVEFAGLGDELSRIVSQSPERQMMAFLEVLRGVSGVRAAAVYVGEGKAPFTKQEQLGSASGLPDHYHMGGGEENLLASALRNETMVSQRTLWDRPPMRAPGLLLAAPLGRPDEEGRRVVLAIADMDYLAVRERNFLRIRLLCRWMGLLKVGGEAIVPGAQERSHAGKRIVSPQEFIGALELAADTAREQSRPSTVARLSLPGADKLNPSTLLPPLWKHLSSGGLVTLMPGHPPTLFLMFPARAGELCSRELAALSPSLVEELKLQEEPRSHLWVVDGGESGRGLWAEITNDI